jgi:outer membrane biogenesis lipoprotein LolB
MALIGLSSGLLLSACTLPAQEPPPVPGQPLTWQQKHAQDVKNYQELGDARRNNNRPCPPSSCK